MPTTPGKCSLIDLKIQVGNDTHVNMHRAIEDTAICLGLGLREALDDKRGIKRFGDATISLDEALARTVIDVASRSYITHENELTGQERRLIGDHLTGPMTRHALESLAFNSGICLHVSALSGRDPHYVIKAQLKAPARALHSTIEPDSRIEGIPLVRDAL